MKGPNLRSSSYLEREALGRRGKRPRAEGTGKSWGTNCPLAVELGTSVGTAKEWQREIKICRRASNRPKCHYMARPG